jgi:hypothetical protein
MGGGWKGGSVYSQPGSRVDVNSLHDTKEGFPSKSKGDFKQIREGFPCNKRGVQKGVKGMHLNVYIVLIKDCV